MQVRTLSSMAVCVMVLTAQVGMAQRTDVGQELSEIQRDVLRETDRDRVPEGREPDVDADALMMPDFDRPSETDVDEDSSATNDLATAHVLFEGDWSVLVEERMFSALRQALLMAEGDEATIWDVLDDYQGRLVGRGYSLARLTLESVTIVDGAPRLTVNVDAARFGELSFWRVVDEDGVPVREPFRGRHFSESQLRRRLDDFSADRHFNYGEFYNRLYDINMHPDLTLHARLRLRQHDERHVDMEMTVDEKLPLHAILEINNTGTESTKEWRAGLTLQHLNLFRRDDVLTLRGINATDLSSLNSFALSYRLPYRWGKGGAATAFGGYSRIDSDEIAPDISIRGSGWFAGFQGAHRMIDTRRHVVSLGFGGVYRSMEDQLVFADTRGRKREAEALPVSLALSYASKRDDAWWGRNYLTVETIYNLGVVMDVSSDEAFNDLRQNAKEEYAVYRVQLARLQSLYFGTDTTARRDWSVFVKGEGQYADGALIPAEQVSVGGMSTVRGYEERALLGDHGGFATIELRTPILQDLVTRAVRWRKAVVPEDSVDRLQLIAFGDVGFISRAELLQGEERSESISSAGMGVRWAFSRYAQIRADVGYRLDELFSQDKGFGFHVSAQLQY